MTNKALIFAILVIVLAGGGTAAYYYHQQTKPLEYQPQPEDQASTPLELVPYPDPSAKATTTPDTSGTNNPGVCQRNFDQNKLSNNSNLNIQNRQVEINVKDFGKITLQFYPKDAPKAVENFLRLTDSGFYNCLTFHRVAKGFVIQGGDPKGDGTGGQSAFGQAFADELNPATPSYQAGYVKGVLAMANSGPNTNSSQFFIMLADNNLPHLYTIFGKVLIGQSVVDKIGLLDTNPPGDGKPVAAVVMESVKIIK